ncbi:MAG TPA: J domain-containing protein [Microthrixaceae bacterium]|nr:J domain-containing protein [Microthrixaceae bacterium]
MNSAAERNHYEVLGVDEAATIEEIRYAHRQAARVLHPDRHMEGTDADRRLAERRMREVNGAWSVLSDPKKRADYDRGRSAFRVGQGESTASAGRPSASVADEPQREFPADFDDQFGDDEVVPEWQYWMFKRGPVIAVLLVAAVLFVATAYAGSAGGGSDDGDSPTPTTEPKRECVSITSAGRSAVRVPCSEENDGRVVTRVEAALDCPKSTTYVLVHEEFLCVTTDPSVVGSDVGG